MYEYFKDWDASTGAFLPITDDWVVAKAKILIGDKKRVIMKKGQPKKSGKKRLF